MDMELEILIIMVISAIGLSVVGVISLFVMASRLYDRIRRIEAALHPEEAPSSAPEPRIAAPPREEAPRSAVASSSAHAGPTWIDQFAAWCKEDWLLKLGALLLLIGFGWLATYAFLHNWIGPMGRISLGIVAGALILVFGWWRIKRFLHQGSIFLVLGSTVILLTIFAAREIYEFFTPASALAVMFLSTAFVAFASVVYRTRSLALLSLVLAGIAPFFTNSPSPDYVMLFAYLLVVTLGAIWIVALTGARELTTASLILFACYSAPHLLGAVRADKGVLLLFAYAFAAVFFIANTLGALALKHKKVIPDLLTAGGNGLLLLAWIMTAAPKEWQSMIITAWMAVFAVGGFLIFKITRTRAPFFVYAGVGVVMLAAATSAELKGATLTIAYAVEAGIVTLTAYALLHDIRIAERAAFLLCGPAALSLQSLLSPAWTRRVWHKDFFVLLVLAAVLSVLGVFFLAARRRAKRTEASFLHTVLLIGGSLYGYALLWRSLHAALADADIAVMISLCAFTLIGLFTHFYGRARGMRTLRIYGAALLGAVVARLLLVDVWNMELTGKIITFFLVGALLVSTAFFGRKKSASHSRAS